MSPSETPKTSNLAIQQFNDIATPNKTRSESNLTDESQSGSMMSGASISEAGGRFAAVAEEQVNNLKETVLDTAVPRVGEALKDTQDRIRSFAGGGGESDANVEPPDPDTTASEDQERIEHLDTERICDFLREKHKSTKPPPLTK